MAWNTEWFLSGSPDAILHVLFATPPSPTVQSLSNDEILTEIRKYPSSHVCLTGGEPSLQKLPQEFIDLLKANGKIIHIETLTAPKTSSKH